VALHVKVLERYIVTKFGALGFRNINQVD